MSERLIDHLQHHEFTVTFVDENNPDPDVTKEDFILLEEREGEGVDEQWRYTVQRSTGRKEYPYVENRTERIAAWRITEVTAEGTTLVCTAWEQGIDPRSVSPHDPEITHADPDDETGLGFCPIHEL